MGDQWVLARRTVWSGAVSGRGRRCQRRQRDEAPPANVLNGSKVRQGARRRTRDQGSATVELAASLPALVLMMLAGLTSVTAVRTQLECVDAAREAARAAARGDAGQAAGERVAPAGATVSVTTDGDTVRARVVVRVHPLGGRLPGFDVSAVAVAAAEPASYS